VHADHRRERFFDLRHMVPRKRLCRVADSILLPGSGKRTLHPRGGEMTENTNTPIVRDLMAEFAGLTGLDPPRTRPRRYLWTDAYAVCNHLELFRRTGDGTYRDLALRLVDQVHHTLGRHRDD